ncbi:hypothetical protein MRX96_032655 [Rhipicephalus microplus]
MDENSLGNIKLVNEGARQEAASHFQAVPPGQAMEIHKFRTRHRHTESYLEVAVTRRPEEQGDKRVRLFHNGPSRRSL